MKTYTQEELKTLSTNEAEALAAEIRRYLVEHVLLTGGHLASNLGIVEISLGLLRVFSLPEDDILYDTGHQSYVHKLLTDRFERFDSLRQYGGISGFPRRSESRFDSFGAGHSGTAVSAALGLARARVLKGESGHHTVAVLGDGAFTCGMVHEALNNVRRDDHIIIVLNDNDMSISKSVGRLSRYLTRVRKSERYFSLKKKSHRFLDRLPLVGRGISRLLARFKRAAKEIVYHGNLFEQYGIHYLGPAHGNDLNEVERLLKEAKAHKGPVLVHLTTKKGKGYAPAEKNPGEYHSVAAGRKSAPCDTFSSIFGQTLCRLAKTDEKLVAITAAMEEGTGLSVFHKEYPDRFFDVGISEEHAMTFAAGLAAGGLKPVFSVYSTFFQRSYDQLFHDLALQDLGGIVALDRAGFADSDGPTHHGLFDVSLTLPLPGVRLFSPATHAELIRILEAVTETEMSSPVVVRYPKGGEKEFISSRFSSERLMERWDSAKDARVLILTYGRITEQALLAADKLFAAGVFCTVVKLTCLKPFDPQALKTLVGEHYELCFCLEEGIASGGFFEHLLSDIATGCAPSLAEKYHLQAVRDAFVPHGTYQKLLEHTCLDADSVARKIATLL